MDVDIRYFDPGSIKDGAVVLLVGRRGSGKSTMAADIMSYRRETKRGVCVSATERDNRFWGEHIPGCFIHHDYDESITKDLFRMQIECKKQMGQHEPCFAIYDDLMFDKSFIKSKSTRELFMNGRHKKIFTLITAQWVMDIPPDLRANVDVVIVMRDNIMTNRERIYRYFAGVFPTFAAFDEVMKQCTQGREAMVLDQNSRSYDVRDTVFFYQATPELKYKLCEPYYWKFSEEQPKEEATDGDRSKKKGVRVKKLYPDQHQTQE